MLEKEFKEALRSEILKSVSIQHKKNLSKTAQQKKEEDKINELDLDNIIFNGGYKDKPISKVIGLNESEEQSPMISSFDINDFENEMNGIVNKYPNTTILFEPQGNQKKSIVFKKTPSGFMAMASGYINIGNSGKLRWIFSIPNGMRIETDGLEITEENRDIITDLYNYYRTWEQDWRKKLSSKEPSEDDGESMEGEENMDTQPNLNEPPIS